ncbi:hypothetical protein [Empedobacter sedimenti]|uniref:hypothetical protein n=1 Tax=Empedobacter sedimenti TaxID=3042610 RepID=UPI0024A6B500|nr:hypothetical protein [Empedobacter sedimenti]
MTDKFRGNIFQDDTFVYTGADGLVIEELLTLENRSEENVVLVYIKIQGQDWQQYFLDVGIGFWQNYENINPWDEVDEEYQLIDKALEFGIKHKKIQKIWCEPNENNSQITIEFDSNERIILKTREPKIFDSNCELILIKP